jgi:S-DNA-T family DNA segregation ATPase FtsK/SpoIIIE
MARSVVDQVFDSCVHGFEAAVRAVCRALWIFIAFGLLVIWKCFVYAWRKVWGGVGGKPRTEWAKALALCNLTDDLPCRVTGWKETPFGESYRILLDGGKHADQLRPHTGKLASALGGAMKVEIRESKKSSREVYVDVIRRDVLEKTVDCPWAKAAVLPTLRDGIPMGIDRSGAVVFLKLLYNNLLLGGLQGAGKSVAMALIVACAIFDPTVEVYLLDFKGTDLGPWAPAAKRFADRDIDQVIDILRDATATMFRRLEEMKAAGKRKVLLSQGLILIAIDEIASYLQYNDGDKERSKEFRDEFSALLHDLVRMGRGVGIMVVAATQHPHHEVVPTTLRNIFSYRVALRVVNGSASDIILGTGWAGRGYNAQDIETALKGKAYLLHEESLPQLVRFYNLDDPDFEALVARSRLLASTDLPGASQPHLTLVPAPSDARTDDQTLPYPPETPLHRLNGGLTSSGKEADQSPTPGLPPVSNSPSSPSIPHPPAGPAPLPPDPLRDLIRVLDKKDLKLLHSMSKLHDLPEGWCSPRVYQVLRAQRYGDALSADQQMKRWMRAKGDGITGKSAKPGLKLVEQRPHDPTKGAASPLEYRLTSLGWQLVGRIRMPETETEGADA